MKSQEDLLKEAKARGAVIVDDSQPGSGFTDDLADDVACVSGRAGTPEQQMRYDDPAVEEMEKRAREAADYMAHHCPTEIDEATKQAREDNMNAVRKYRFTHQEDYVDWVPGRILWLGDFLSMLQQIRPDAFYAEYAIQGRRGIGFIINGKPEYSGVSIGNGNCPEWSQLRVDARGLPLSEKYRGWRTVLLALIKRDIITVEQCDAVFGKPTGPRSRPWYRTLFSIRNGRCPECGHKICDCSDGWDYLRSDAYAYEVPADVAKGNRQVVDTSEHRIWMPN